MNIKLLVVCGAIAVGLTGCPGPATRVIHEAHPVPVPVVPAPPDIKRPVVELDTLPEMNKPVDQLTDAEKRQIAYYTVVAAVQWKQYALELETVVDGYRDAHKMAKEAQTILETDINAVNLRAAEILKSIKVKDAEQGEASK